MKIAFISTRGIPNNYGGFEQFAEYISVGLVRRGHEVVVYSPHFHPYREPDYKGVRIMHIPADTRSAFPLISVHSPVTIQYRWQS